MNRGREMLDRVGLDSVDPAQFTSQISTSQMQLVQVVRALADGGDVFLFDEPSLSLSPSEFTQVALVIRQLRG